MEFHFCRFIFCGFFLPVIYIFVELLSPLFMNIRYKITTFLLLCLSNPHMLPLSAFGSTQPHSPRDNLLINLAPKCNVMIYWGPAYSRWPETLTAIIIVCTITMRIQEIKEHFLSFPYLAHSQAEESIITNRKLMVILILQFT